MAGTYKGRITDRIVLETAWNRIRPLLEIDENGCWLLLATRSKREDYYPIICVDGFHEPAHRISYRYHKGELPEDQPIVRHTCHTPRCCNPAHLISGTVADNMQDKYEAGRCHRPVGEKSPRAKIPDSEIMAIYSSDEARDVLAERYGVWSNMITRIRTGKHSLTKHLPPRKFNTKEYFTEERKHNMSLGRRKA